MTATARSRTDFGLHPSLSPLARQVGETPLIPLARIVEGLSPDVHLYAKAEWLNPSGSIKDRPAVAILEDAVRSGRLGDRTMLDSSSGNMGIGYATFAPRSGSLAIHLVVPGNINPARLQILRALDVELTFSDPLEGSDGARVVASEMAAQEPERFLYLDQYSNPANPRSHFEGTGPEVLRQTSGRVTHIVGGLGTGGTITGIGQYLRGRKPSVQIIAVQPDGPLHGLEGLKHYATSPIPQVFDREVPDQMISVSTEEAYEMVRWLARQEGLLVGISSGAAAVAARQVARQLDHGVLVVLFPDSGSRYLDSPVWERGN